MKIGNIDIEDFKMGNIDANAIYLGNDLVWERDFSDKPLLYIANGPDINENKLVYFYTGVIPSKDTIVEIQAATYIKEQTWPLGEVAGNDNWNGLCFYMGHTSSSAGETWVRVNSQSFGTNQEYTSNDIMTMKAYLDLDDPNPSYPNQWKGKFECNGITYSSSGYTGSTGTPYELTLLNRNSANGITASNRSGLKVYYCKIWEGETLIRDYIPVLHWNNNAWIPCFYDRVNNNYIYNQGSDEPYYVEL